MVTPIYAAVPDPVTPQYTHISSILAQLSIDESTGIATCYGKVSSKSASSVKVICKLQRYENGSWNTLKTWTSTGIAAAVVNEPYAVKRGYTYRVYVIGYAYDENGALLDTATRTYSKTYPK